MFGKKHTYKTTNRTKNIWGHDKVTRKHYKGGLFGGSYKTVSTYKKDWLGRTVKTTRKASWWE